jgi:hypothetical protein
MRKDNYDKLRRLFEACMALSNDKSTTDAERAIARKKAAMIAEKLHAMGRNVSMDATDDVAEANYKAYVEQGLQAKQNIHLSQWALGALASNITIEYKKGKLQEYAEDIGEEYSTLRHYRATYMAWRDPKGRPESFAVARALNTHPDRYQIVKDNPHLTAREAEDIMRQHKAKSAPGGKSAPRGKAKPQAQPQPQPSPQPTPQPQPDIDTAEKVYLELLLKRPVKERTRRLIKLMNDAEVKMS